MTTTRTITCDDCKELINPKVTYVKIAGYGKDFHTHCFRSLPKITLCKLLNLTMIEYRLPGGGLVPIWAENDL